MTKEELAERAEAELEGPPIPEAMRQERARAASAGKSRRRPAVFRKKRTS